MSLLDIKIILNIFTVISLKCAKYLIENREKFFEAEILYNAAYYIESTTIKNTLNLQTDLLSSWVFLFW